MHYYSVVVMSIGAVRMHRGLEDRVALCGHQAETVDIKEEQSVKAAVQFTSSSHEVKWSGGQKDNGSPGKEVV